MKPVLLAGETFHVTSFAAKGYEVGASSRYSNGAERYIKGLAAHDIAVVQIGGERCESEFPTTIEALAPIRRSFFPTWVRCRSSIPLRRELADAP